MRSTTSTNHSTNRSTAGPTAASTTGSTSASGWPRRRHRGAAFVAINTDWDILCRSGRARRSLRTWRAGEHATVFDDVDTLGDIIDAHAGCVTPAESDRWLVPLVQLAADGDEIAARVVLQTMLPMAIGLYRGGGVTEQWNVISTLAEQIGRYPVDTHPTGVFSHLRYMTRRALYRQHRRRRLPTCPLDTPATAHDDPGVSRSVMDALVADADSRSSFDRVCARVVDVVSCGGIDADRASLILAVAAGHGVVELANSAGCHHSVMSRRVTAATSTIARAA